MDKGRSARAWLNPLGFVFPLPGSVLSLQIPGAEQQRDASVPTQSSPLPRDRGWGPRRDHRAGRCGASTLRRFVAVGSQACHSCCRRMRSPRREVGAGGPVAWQHRTDRRNSEAVRGGESSSVANNLISVSCLTMEKSHVVRGSKNRLGKLLTTFADVKGKARAVTGEKTSPAVPPWH